MRWDAEPLVFVKDGDQLDDDFATLLIGRHSHQKPSAGDGNSKTFWGINQA